MKVLNSETLFSSSSMFLTSHFRETEPESWKWVTYPLPCSEHRRPRLLRFNVWKIGSDIYLSMITGTHRRSIGDEYTRACTISLTAFEKGAMVKPIGETNKIS